MRLCVPIVLALVSLTAATRTQAIELGLGESGPLVEDIEAGSEVALLAVLRHPGEYMARVEELAELLADVDRNGQLELEVTAGVPPASTWAAIELASGAVALAAGGEAQVREIAGPDLITSLAPIVAIPHQAEGIVVLVVRPGQGAWSGRAADGAPSDADGQPDGWSTVGVGAMQSLDANREEKLTELQSGDVVVTIVPRTLQVWTAVVQ